MKPKFSKKLFPFSPGIPWTIKNNKYIVPHIDANIWKRSLIDKDFIIACYGGFMESFFSLSYCEAISSIDPYRVIKWMGNPDFESLVSMQRIASINSFDLGIDIIEKYPVPIFMDNKNNAYFNVLNDYIKTKSIKSKDFFINKEIWGEQIYKNCLIPWDFYLPKIRVRLDKYREWKKTKIHSRARYILIFPYTWNSMHEENCLNWSDRQIRELASLVKHKGIYVVACGFRDDGFRHSGVISAPMDLEIIIGLMADSFSVLSADIDNLIITMALSSKSIIMSRDLSNIFDLYKNAEFFNCPNVIFTDKELLPIDVYQFLEGINE